ncbi:unnamed protein product [Phytophthora fragariaefolia]|uniref:Unnamed protein product n=1 Tax=Phytophthora fragariaefolia TaxID=1490495 RepID=A0A9W7CTJ1_9STRA|nr:unnamed protein product [Phytophthora fragariaefolia]
MTTPAKLGKSGFTEYNIDFDVDVEYLAYLIKVQVPKLGDLVGTALPVINEVGLADFTEVAIGYLISVFERFLTKPDEPGFG